MNFKEFFAYGEKVEGYDVRVMNEREARAAAGILFAFGLISLTNAVMLSNGIVTKFFISFFTFDFFLRITKPEYSPSLLLGRFFVQNQTPEYVGATQKRFAWSLGFLLALPMFYLLVIHWQPNPMKVFICIICLLLLFAESAFSICVGCKLYNIILKSAPSHCPGGVCEIRKKEKIQTFNAAQKFIVVLTFLVITVSFYNYFFKLENKTHIGKVMSVMLMSDEELKALEEAAYEKELADFENDDDF